MTVQPIDVTPEVFSESDPARVANMAQQDQGWAGGMLIDRRGQRPASNMTAIGMHRLAKYSEVYRSSAERGLELVEDVGSTLELEAAVARAHHDEAPLHTTIVATWGSPGGGSADVQNVLGDSVLLEIDGEGTDIGVPVLEATSHHLGYYGAVLVEEGAFVRFPAPDYPIWKMELGKNYVDGFVMTDVGGGFYLEYHRDRPHWHQPLTSDSGGFYVLAKRSPGRAGHYQLTGFRIPFGCGVYTGLGSMHCDAALTGQNWLVGYADSDDFSTALLRNRDGARVKLVGNPGV